MPCLFCTTRWPRCATRNLCHFLTPLLLSATLFPQVAKVRNQLEYVQRQAKEQREAAATKVGLAQASYAGLVGDTPAWTWEAMRGPDATRASGHRGG